MLTGISFVLAAALCLALNGPSGAPAELPADTFVEVARSDAGGHFFSQVIYAPPVKAFVSWGTQTHSRPIRTHETRHFLIDENRWIDALPAAEDDPIWTRVYLCEQNRRVPLEIDTPEYTVHEVALEYDPIHRVAVLLWPPSFEADIRPHLFRLDTAKLAEDISRTTCGRRSLPARGPTGRLERASVVRDE